MNIVHKIIFIGLSCVVFGTLHAQDQPGEAAVSEDVQAQVQNQVYKSFATSLMVWVDHVQHDIGSTGLLGKYVDGQVYKLSLALEREPEKGLPQIEQLTEDLETVDIESMIRFAPDGQVAIEAYGEMIQRYIWLHLRALPFSDFDAQNMYQLEHILYQVPSQDWNLEHTLILRKTFEQIQAKAHELNGFYQDAQSRSYLKPEQQSLELKRLESGFQDTVETLLAKTRDIYGLTSSQLEKLVLDFKHQRGRMQLLHVALKAKLSISSHQDPNRLLYDVLIEQTEGLLDKVFKIDQSSVKIKIPKTSKTGSRIQKALPKSNGPAKTKGRIKL